MDLATDVLGVRVGDVIVLEPVTKTTVTAELVCVDRGAERYPFGHVLGVGLAASVNDLSPNGIGLTVLGTLHRSLGDHATAANPDLSLPHMHVLCLAADVGLVNLDGAGHLLVGRSLKGESNPVKHEPRGLLRDTQRTAQLVRADRVLGVRDQPDGGQPLVEPDWGVLKDRCHLDAELPFAAFALPYTAGLDVSGLFVRAPWADDRTVIPAHPHDESERPVVVGEIVDRLDQVGRLKGF